MHSPYHPQDTYRHTHNHLLNLARRAQSQTTLRTTVRPSKSIAREEESKDKMPIFWEEFHRETIHIREGVQHGARNKKSKSVFFRGMLRQEIEINDEVGKKRSSSVERAVLLRRIGGEEQRRTKYDLVEEHLYKKMRQPQSPSASEYLQAKNGLFRRRSLFTQASFKLFLMD